MSLDARLATDAALTLLNALVFAQVGRLVLQRKPAGADDQRALRQFATWWFALAGMNLFTMLRGAFAAVGATDVSTHATLQAASFGPLCLALWGLTSYLAYVYWGHHRHQRLLVAYHVLLLYGLTLMVALHPPVSVEVQGWTATVVPESRVSGLPRLLILSALLGPVLGAALAYGRLFSRTQDPATRRRIRLVAVAFLGWFGVLFVANVTPLAAWDWWPPVARLLALSSTLLLVLAYRPHARGAPDPAAEPTPG